MRYSAQRGAVAPLVAVLLFVIVICVAFVVDLGHIHSVKGQLQRAVDAAALAAARQLPNEIKVTAVAEATARINTVDGQFLADLLDNESDQTTLSVDAGFWDTIDLGGTPATRWDTDATPSNAVKVRASRDVDHVFFFFLDSTLVVADAIALAEPINPVQPLALVSCIPMEDAIDSPTNLPGTNPEDIRYFIFANDTDDSAAWTSLTLDVNASEMANLLDKNNEDNLLFQQIIFGLGLTNNGIENTAPKLSGDCLLRNDNDGTNISCGLGGYNLGSYPYLAPPELIREPTNVSFPDPPATIPRNATTLVYEPDSGLDPLTHYRSHSGTPGYLPRWYQLGDDDVHETLGGSIAARDLLWTDDHFARIWTLDGILLKGENETPADYLVRLKGYYTGDTPPPTAPFNTYNFQTDELITALDNNAVEPLIAYLYDIDLTNGNNPALNAAIEEVEAALEAIDGDDTIYFPDYLKIVGAAGYPEVGVSNGVIANLMSTFMSKPEISDGENLICAENEPLADEGETLRIQLPIIFAGFCETWKALSLPNDVFNLYYIGMSDFLVTRTWDNPDEYDCGANFVNCADCPDVPPLSGGDFTRVSIPSVRAIEGLVQPPKLDESEASSAIKVFLVE